MPADDTPPRGFADDDEVRPADPFESTAQYEPVTYSHVRTKRRVHVGRVLVPLAVGLLLGGIAGASLFSGDEASDKASPSPRPSASTTPGAGHWVEGDEATASGRVGAGVNGAIILQGAEIPTSVACGGDLLLVFTTSTAFEPEGTVAESLAGKRVRAMGRLDRLKDGPCALVATSIEVLGAASPTPSGSPRRSPTPTPRTGATPSSTTRPPGPTATPAPATPAPTASPVPTPTPLL